MKCKLYAVRVFSRRWEESLAFYRDTVGLEVKYTSRDLGWAELDVGGVSLGLERVAEDDPEGSALVGRFVGASLQVDDVQAVYEELVGKGVRFTGPPAKQPWGGVLAHFEDPDGNVLTLLGQG